MSYALFFLATFGFAFVIGHSKLSLPFRMILDPGNRIETFEQSARMWLLMLLECPACIGVHIGFWIGLFPKVFYVEAPAAIPRLLWAVELALASCAVSFLLAKFTLDESDGE